MKTKKIALAAVLLAAPVLAVVAQPALATTVVDLTLQSFTYNITGVVGTAPTVNTGNNIPTSNAGYVDTLGLPYTFDLTQGVAQTPSPDDPLFVVEPQNPACYSGCPTDTATIAVTLNFKYNGVSYPLTEDVDFSATEPDTDSLTWVGGTTVTGGKEYAFTIDGQNFSITLDNETDWNMAQYDGATEYTGPSTTVPEPASLVLLGTALMGFGAIRRRRKSV